MKNILRRAIAVSVIASLVGCANFPGVRPSAAVFNGDFNALQRDIVAQQQNYSKGSNDWAYSEFWSNLVLIPLAMGSVAALAFSHGAATTNILAGIGIGVGAVSLFTSNLNASNKQQSFSLASNQLLCVNLTATGPYFEPATSDISTPRMEVTRPRDFKQLHDDLGTLNTTINIVSADLSKVNQNIAKGFVPSSDQSKTINIATLSLQQASNALNNGNAEMLAGNQGYIVIARTFSKIDQQAYAQAKGTLLTWSQATGAFTSTTTPSTAPSASALLQGLPQTGAKALGAAAAAPPSDPDVDALGRNTTTLLTSAGSVANSAIVQTKLYTTANSNIASCATLGQ
ncbi:hypothetical protein VSR82_13915 [Burkholderia sp. JPY481]